MYVVMCEKRLLLIIIINIRCALGTELINIIDQVITLLFDITQTNMNMRLPINV